MHVSLINSLSFQKTNEKIMNLYTLTLGDEKGIRVSLALEGKECVANGEIFIILL